ncbi:ATP-binding protein [Mariprofundus micogutta]|uniref:ATP-binding protein n=1 Tax=Mariprofundus micogutta TaxID=1921010 RepID=UPI0009F9F987|nr:ATP-binding protein [Mariprofundus micogutta]
MKLLFSGYGNYSPDESGQKAVLMLLLTLSISVCSVFSIINFLYGHEWLAYVLIIVGLSFVPVIINGYRGCWFNHSREIFMCLAFLTFVALFADGGIANTGIYWGLIFPFLAFLLMGVRIGWLWVAAFVFFYAGLLVLDDLGFMAFSYSADTLRFVPAMFLCFSIIACAFQLQQERRQTELQQINDDLKTSEEELRHAQDHLEQTVHKRTEQLRIINQKLSQEVDEKIEALQQKEFAEMKYEHAQKMESMGTLVGGIAHDFNNMLSGITANLYLIQRQIDAPEAQRRLDKIGDLTMHAADMIRQLMTFARKDVVTLAEFDLGVFLKEAYKLAKVSVPEHICCDLVLPEGKCLIKGDTTQIQQILMNLMNNARDALSGVNEPFINVSLVRSKAGKSFLRKYPDARNCEYVILTVEDNGCGIPEEKLNRIYEPFFTTKEVGKGTGLGLSMVYGAIQSHGGFIDLVSHLGKGTTFNIYLPLLESEHAAIGWQNKAIETGQGECLLLVDDDENLLDVSEQLLRNLGYRVLTATNGLQAVEVYKANPGIDLVLMDIVMPVLGGKAAADRIQKLNPDAKVIFISGYDRDHEATLEMVSDWNMVLNKPLAVDELSRVIRQRLN